MKTTSSKFLAISERNCETYGLFWKTRVRWSKWTRVSSRSKTNVYSRLSSSRVHRQFNGGNRNRGLFTFFCLGKSTFFWSFGDCYSVNAGFSLELVSGLFVSTDRSSLFSSVLTRRDYTGVGSVTEFSCIVYV